MMKTRVVTIKDNLDKLVRDINQGSWDKANDIAKYDVESLTAYLNRQDTIFLSCHESATESASLLGIASSRIEIKPYGKELWLYVDEVDVCANQRQRGVGRLIMQELLAIAEQEGCEQLWLGAELDNHPANALYQSLKPDDVSQVVGYTYETD